MLTAPMAISFDRIEFTLQDLSGFMGLKGYPRTNCSHNLFIENNLIYFLRILSELFAVVRLQKTVDLKFKSP
jgi:hypothetical protein